MARSAYGLIVPYKEGEYWVVTGRLHYLKSYYPVATILDHFPGYGILLPAGVVLEQECWLVDSMYSISVDYFRREKYHLYKRVDPRVVDFLKTRFNYKKDFHGMKVFINE